MIFKYIKYTCLIVLFIPFLSCSVGMAVHGEKTPDLRPVKIGATRGEVELQLGSPVKTASTDNGDRLDTYHYEVGNDPSPGRAIGHGVLDVLTLGFWELIGTPIEGFQGKKYEVVITYNKEDKVIKIGN